MATPEELTQRRKDAIKKRMDRTRARLADRLHTLGETIHGVAKTVEEVKETVESTAETVQGTVKSTVETVQDTVKSTVETVQETVHSTVETAKEALDFRKHPLAWLGGSVAAGYLVGRWMHDERKAPAVPAYPAGYPYPAPAPPASAPAAPPPAPEKPGMLDSLKGIVGNYLDQAKGLGIGAAVGLLRDLVVAEVPEGLRSDVMEMGNNLIKDLGGQIVEPGTLDLSFLTGGKSDQNGQREQSAGARTTHQAGAAVPS
jgi:gas vesicle protein